MLMIFGEDEGTFNDETNAFFHSFDKAASLLCDREDLDSDICEVSISFESEDGIRQLNAKYRGIDAVTDVLSFPMYESKEDLLDEIENADDEVSISLGDVVICVDVAKKQAEEYGHSEEREMVYLFVHSLLHLCGYDHEDEDEQAEMRVAEEEIMEEIGLVR